MSNWAVYDTDGKRLLSTTNILKARGFASVRRLKVESDKGETKTNTIIENPIQKEIVEVSDKDEVSNEHKDYAKVTSEEILEQQQKDQEILSKMGIGQTAAVFAEGSKLDGTGIQNLAKSKREWENLPKFDEAIDQIIKTVENEKREARLIPKKQHSP